MPATPGNALNITSSGLVRFDGTATFSGVTTTNHNVLLGAASNGITNLAPSATTGIAVVSQGAAADPAFSTVVVAGGGTGQVTLTAHSVLIGNGTSGITQVGPVASTGAILASNGVGSDPGFTTATYPLTTAQGDLLSSTSANTIVALAKDTNATRYLSNTGTNNNAAWAQVNLANGVTGTLTVPNGGTGIATTTAYGLIAGGTTATGVFQNTGAGTATQYLISNGASALPSFQSPTGGVVQQVRTSTATRATGTATIPWDDSIPQNTEGTELFTLSITPKSASNVLIFTFSCMFATSISDQVTFALFQDSTANALYATDDQNLSPSSGPQTVNFTFYMTAGTTSSTTFKIRYGANTGSTYINGNTGRIYGGVALTSLIITEVFP